jgi:hypothetical protein
MKTKLLLLIFTLFTLNAHALTIIKFQGVITETDYQYDISWAQPPEVGDTFSGSFYKVAPWLYNDNDGSYGDLSFIYLGEFWESNIVAIPGGYSFYGQTFGGWGSDNVLQFAYGTNANSFLFYGWIPYGGYRDGPLYAAAEGTFTSLSLRNVPEDGSTLALLGLALTPLLGLRKMLLV